MNSPERLDLTQTIDDLLALQNKRAIATGGAQGLAVASHLASCSVQVFIVDLQERLAMQAATQLPSKQPHGPKM